MEGVVGDGIRITSIKINLKPIHPSSATAPHRPIMESSNLYPNAGQPWSTEENEQLIREYNEQKMGLMQLCEIHKRQPGGIIARLRRLNILDRKEEPRGYQEFVESPIYQEKVEKNEKRIARREVGTKVVSELEQLKMDVADIKRTVHAILNIMNALYEMETS